MAIRNRRQFRKSRNQFPQIEIANYADYGHYVHYVYYAYCDHFHPLVHLFAVKSVSWKLIERIESVKIKIVHLEKPQSTASSSSYSQKKLDIIYLFVFSPSRTFSVESLCSKVNRIYEQTYCNGRYNQPVSTLSFFRLLPRDLLFYISSRNKSNRAKYYLLNHSYPTN